MPLNDPVFMYCPTLQDDSASGTITDLSVSGGYDINNTGTWVADTGSGGVRAVELNSTQSHTFNGTMPPEFASMDGGIADNGRTLAIWVYLNNFGGARTALNIANFTGSGSSPTGYRFGGNLSGGTAEGYAEASLTVGSTSGGSTPPGQWIHLAYTIERTVSSNSTTTKLYVDGTLVDTDTTTVPDSTLNRIVIGAELSTGGTLSDFLDGRWDDARGYNYALSAAEITNLASDRGYGGLPYANPEGLGSEIAWWCPSLRDDSASANISDLTGNSNSLTPNGIGASNWVSDTTDGGTTAIELDGSSEWCSAATAVQVATDATWTTQSIWINPDASDTAFFVMGNVDNDGDGGWRIQYFSSNLRVAQSERYKDYSFTRGVWTHLLTEFNNTTYELNLYIDGVLATPSGSSLATPTNDTAFPFNIGRYPNTSFQHMDGRWDDARLFNTQLTAGEITHLASARGVEGPPGDPVNGLPAESASDAEIVNITVRDPLPVTDAESVTQAEQVDIPIRTVSPVDAESVTDAETASVPLATSVSLLDGQSLTQAQRVAVVKRYGLTLVDTESITEGGRVDIQNNPDLTAVNAESLSDAEQVEIGASPAVFGQAAQSRSDAEVLDNNALLIHKSITVTDAVSVTDAATLELDSLRSIAVTDSQSLSEAESVLLPRLQAVALDTQSVSDAARLQIGVNPLVGFGQGFTMSTGFFDLNGFL